MSKKKRREGKAQNREEKSSYRKPLKLYLEISSRIRDLHHGNKRAPLPERKALAYQSNSPKHKGARYKRSKS